MCQPKLYYKEYPCGGWEYVRRDGRPDLHLKQPASILLLLNLTLAGPPELGEDFRISAGQLTAICWSQCESCKTAISQPSRYYETRIEGYRPTTTDPMRASADTVFNRIREGTTDTDDDDDLGCSTPSRSGSSSSSNLDCTSAKEAEREPEPDSDALEPFDEAVSTNDSDGTSAEGIEGKPELEVVALEPEAIRRTRANSLAM
ncbi:hypothetical protein DFP72DRAFT_847396 [Ephemerocybe angulata]|uniref:Uncharacterized protein n=1 Tax=Ephemerocybe angulata TaxID=980116 RepID=A0A8H6M869_9AGAR|nr:hypothetical protein DFP72DRAFT_847396 [Tulosesus angulatus]